MVSQHDGSVAGRREVYPAYICGHLGSCGRYDVSAEMNVSIKHVIVKIGNIHVFGDLNIYIM